MTEPLMILCVGDHRLAVPMREMREILPLLPVETVPGLPQPLRGFVGVRGRAMAVIDPRLLLDPSAPPHAPRLDAHLAVPRGDDGGAAGFCLLVDRVEAIVTPEVQDERPVDPTLSLNGTVVSEIALAQGTARRVRLDRLVTVAERAAAERLAKGAELRMAQWSAVP